MGEPKTCFVVMGFNTKTDYPTGRKLDLDKTYRTIIKPAVEAAGLRCVRADEIVHSGLIDVPMYDQLLSADLVVADISTMNPNALYELGVRHALRPYSTIVIGESRLKEGSYPFDLSHLVIRHYNHGGDWIDYEEAVKFQGALKEAITAILDRPAKDSPVYTHLTGLQRPMLAPAATGSSDEPEPGGDGPLHAQLLSEAEAAMDRSDFAEARALCRMAWKQKPDDPYLVQRLALATYKSRAPSTVDALHEARELLRRLHPEGANDPETLGLWGAVHKRLWEEVQDRAALDASVFAYEKGFYLRNDYYNGINLAYLLNVRAKVSERAEAIADFIGAERVRRRVADICRTLLGDPGSESAGAAPTLTDPERYWVTATLAEALLGIGDEQGYERAWKAALEIPVPAWMQQSTVEQVAKLRDLLADSPLVDLPRASGSDGQAAED